MLEEGCARHGISARSGVSCCNADTPSFPCVAGSTSYRADPKETTEWDDLQRKFGNLPKLEKEVEEEEEEVDDSVAARFAGASAAAMAEAVEDGGLEEDEEAELEAIRARRMQQLMQAAKANKVRYFVQRTSSLDQCAARHSCAVWNRPASVPR